MDAPRWLRQPYSFLRYMVAGFYILAFGAAFFPDVLNNSMFNLFIVQRHEGVAILFILFWALIIGVMMQLAFRVLRATVLQPPRAAQEALRSALQAAGVPADRLTRRQLRAVHRAAAADRGLADPTADGRVGHELSYLACMALASTGGFLVAGLGRGALVSVNWPEAQGAVFIGAAFFFAGFLRWRESHLAMEELAAFPVEDPELVAAAARACHRLWWPVDRAPGAGP